MSSPETDGLRTAYREAFERWAFEVNRLHLAIDCGKGEAVIDEAQDRAAAAQIVYRASRDRLADEMILTSAGLLSQKNLANTIQPGQ